MAIERVLTPDKYQSLSAEDKALYELSDSGSDYKFVGENAGALKRVKDHEVAKRRELTKELLQIKDKLAELESAKEEAEHNKAIESKDHDKINQRWQEKYDKDLNKEIERTKQLQSMMLKSHRENVIDQLTTELAVPKFKHLVRPLIEARIDAELSPEHTPRTIVKDSDGKATANTIKDLTKELLADKRNEDVLKGEAVGSGTTSQSQPRDPQVGDQKVEPSPFQGLGYQGRKLSDADQIVDAFRRAPEERLGEFAKYIPELPQGF